MDCKIRVTTNDVTELEYGMKVLFPCRAISIISTVMGIALTSSDTPRTKIEMVVCKCYESDDDANRYKVKLKPIGELNQLRFGNENLYSSDLKSLIRQGTCSLILED